MADSSISYNMIDPSVSYNRYKFLGHEFLTWLWFEIENQPDIFKIYDDQLELLQIGNRIVLENRLKEHIEVITIKGDDAGFEEGMLALRKGAVVTELNLLYQSNELKWQFTIKGESLNISNLITPTVERVNHPEEIEGAVLEKMYLIEKVTRLITSLFGHFIKQRVSDRWDKEHVPSIKSWIYRNKDQTS